MKKILVRKSAERGFFNHGWLTSYHTFSFADYHDKNFMNFSDLRVINEDVIKPNQGFGLHPHKNMEIITYVLSGSLTHSDNLGNKEEIKAGNFQVMSAGSGIIHGEFNHGDIDCHLLQIWIMPNQNGGEPYYKIHQVDHHEKWALIVSNDGARNSVSIRQNSALYVLESGKIKNIQLPLKNEKNCLIHVASGKIKIADLILETGDACGFRGEVDKIDFMQDSKILVFYLN